MKLFDNDDPNAQVGYRNLRVAALPIEQAIKSGLEELWRQYEPYADTVFLKEFSKHPDERFWEMYLSLTMHRQRKKVRRREEIETELRNTGPDICIKKGRRRIWIEAVSPKQGDEKNLDRVPDLFPASADKGQFAERYQIELRITQALERKARKFARYREMGLIGERDSCIVAISAGQFSLQAIAAGGGLPHAVTAVYPFGDEIVMLDPETGEFSSTSHTYSDAIKNSKKGQEPRTAFQHKEFASISGLIWSLRSIGNFLGESDDFVYVHNQMAERPIARGWFNWAEEYIPTDDGTKLKKKIRRA
jgi:hypothetical protein